MKSYYCDICKKDHEVYYGSNSPLPSILADIAENKSEDRIERFSEDAFVVDKEKLIIKGELKIETAFCEMDITHLLWCEVPISQLAQQYDDLKKGKKITLEGQLISEIPFYDKTKSLEITLRLHQNYNTSRIEVITESQLKKDQSAPISKDRFIELMQRLHHPELYREKSPPDIRPFEVRLVEILEEARMSYSNNQKEFVINISKGINILFQLISSGLMETPSPNGISLHISNDETYANYHKVRQAMSQICEEKQIRTFKWDGIDTYQKKYATNDQQLYIDVKQIAQDVYHENIEDLELDIFEV